MQREPSEWAGKPSIEFALAVEVLLPVSSPVVLYE
jgi:hypothetical protein